MIKLAYSPALSRAYKMQIKNDASLQSLLKEKVKLFIENPYHPQLHTHKLKGHLKDFYAFSLGYNLRIIFYFATDSEVIFHDIGTHDGVY